MNPIDIANVYYWLGSLVSDIEQVDEYRSLSPKVDELKDAINELVSNTVNKEEA